MKKNLILLMAFLMLFTACGRKEVKMGDYDVKIEYLGHGSLKMYFGQRVCYIDPYAGNDYKEPADLILVTHQHADHNNLDLVEKNPGCILFQNEQAIGPNGYNKVNLHGLAIEPVEAYNENHPKDQCVGYIIRAYGKTIYVAGDTSKTNQMELLGDYDIDYAFLPMDGQYNMDIDEAIECEKLIKAKHTIPYHIAPGKLFDMSRAKKFKTPSTMIVKPGEIINITP